MVWKFLFVIYVLVYSLLNYFGLTEVSQTSAISSFDAIGDHCAEAMIILAIIYTFALGWKKCLINEKFNKIFFYFSWVSFVVVSVITYKNSYTPMYSDMLLQAMQNGMVPRHWDFQLLLAVTRIEVLIFVALVLFVIFAPFYVGYYHYSKTMTSLNIAEHSGRKCFAVYLAFSVCFALFSMMLGTTGDFFKFNLFDCFSIVSSFLLLAGVWGYAYNIEYFTQTFWRICLPVCIFIELLPHSFFSQDFLNVTGYTASVQASPIYIIASYLITSVAIFMVYRYACTDVVFKVVEKDKQEEE